MLGLGVLGIQMLIFAGLIVYAVICMRIGWVVTPNDPPSGAFAGLLVGFIAAVSGWGLWTFAGWIVPQLIGPQ